MDAYKYSNINNEKISSHFNRRKMPVNIGSRTRNFCIRIKGGTTDLVKEERGL